jgi:hypothetical protein
MACICSFRVPELSIKAYTALKGRVRWEAHTFYPTGLLVQIQEVVIVVLPQTISRGST